MKYIFALILTLSTILCAQGAQADDSFCYPIVHEDFGLTTDCVLIEFGTGQQEEPTAIRAPRAYMKWWRCEILREGHAEIKLLVRGDRIVVRYVECHPY